MERRNNIIPPFSSSPHFPLSPKRKKCGRERGNEETRSPIPLVFHYQKEEKQTIEKEEEEEEFYPISYSLHFLQENENEIKKKRRMGAE